MDDINEYILNYSNKKKKLPINHNKKDQNKINKTDDNVQKSKINSYKHLPLKH